MYAMCGFNDNPKKYLAFSRQNGTKRVWLENIFKPGINEWEFELNAEPISIRKVFKDFNNAKMKVKTRTTYFEPLENCSGDAFWGYLVQVLKVY